MSYQLNTHWPSRQIFLNSAFAKYSSYEYHWDLNEQIYVPTGYNLLVSVVDAQIPVSYYKLNEHNRFFYVNDNLTSIRAGNYDILSLIDEIHSTIQPLTLTYDIVRNKVTISSAQAFSIRNDSSRSRFLKVLGFDLDLYEGSTSYTSEGQVNMAGVSSIYVSSQELVSMNIDSFSKTSSHILCKIPATASSNGIIFYDGRDQKQLIKTRGVSEITIALFDHEYNPLDLNGVPWSITLQFDYIRDLSPTN